jgi:hypothetical protein
MSTTAGTVIVSRSHEAKPSSFLHLIDHTRFASFLLYYPNAFAGAFIWQNVNVAGLLAQLVPGVLEGWPALARLLMLLLLMALGIPPAPLIAEALPLGVRPNGAAYSSGPAPSAGRSR